MIKNKLLIIVSILILIFVLSLKFGSFFGNKKLDILATKVIKNCSSKEDRNSCYDIEIPKLLSKNFVSMEEAFEITKIVQESDRGYLYCHVLGHNLADVETKKDPSKWLDVVSRCPALACNNGCPHGAIMRRFKGEEVLTNEQIETIVPDLKIACEKRNGWNPTEVESFMCYHSMGHVFMYITNGDINRSLSLCKEVGVKEDGRDFYQTCTQGVFMIIFQGLDPEDIALVSKIVPKKEDVITFCNRFDSLENTACRTEAWPLFFKDFNDPKGLINFCSFAKTSYDRKWCFDTGLRGPLSLDLLNSSGTKAVSEYCMQMPSDMQSYCFATVATGWVQNEPGYIKDAIDLCNLADNFGLSKECFLNLLYYSQYSFHKDSPQWKDYCNSFDGENKEKCLAGDIPKSIDNPE